MTSTHSIPPQFAVILNTIRELTPKIAAIQQNATTPGSALNNYVDYHTCYNVSLNRDYCLDKTDFKVYPPRSLWTLSEGSAMPLVMPRTPAIVYFFCNLSSKMNSNVDLHTVILHNIFRQMQDQSISSNTKRSKLAQVRDVRTCSTRLPTVRLR